MTQIDAMKKLSRHIFALALLLSLTIHIGLIIGDLIPALLSSNKPPPPPKVVSVKLQALSLDEAPPFYEYNPVTPPTTSVFGQPSGFPPPESSRTQMPLGNGLRNHAQISPPRSGGLHAPRFNHNDARFSDDASGPESSTPGQETANKQQNGQASAPEQETRQQTQMAEASQPSTEQPVNVVTPNTRPPGSGGKAQGARDAQGMIVSSQKLQGLPLTAKLSYQEQNYGVPGTMLWERNGDKYNLTLTINIPFNTMQYRSTGTIDDKQGLRPLQFQESRNNRIRRTARFDWDNQLLYYGDNAEQQTELKDGAQDLLSLSWQLALKHTDIFKANTTQLTNGRKVYEYPIRPGDGRIFDGDNGALRALTVQTREEKESVDVWLAPDFTNIPIRITFKKQGERSLDLQITGIELNGIEEWGRPDKQMKKRQK